MKRLSKHSRAERREKSPEMERYARTRDCQLEEAKKKWRRERARRHRPNAGSRVK